MAAVILTFEDVFADRSLAEHAFRNPGVGGDRTPLAPGLADAPPVEARVNFGRWIADCPNDACVGAELVSFDRPTFFCCACRNAAAGNQALAVAAPGPQKRHEVESCLRARPRVENRNWWHGETVAELRDENRTNKIDLLPEDR